MTCIFCQIAQKKTAAQLIFENEHVVAFNDIKPVGPHHVLIIPKVHLENVNDLTKENASVGGEMMLAAQEIARLRKIDEKGYRLVINNGAQASQTVFHLHLHLIGGRSFSWPPG